MVTSGYAETFHLLDPEDSPGNVALFAYPLRHYDHRVQSHPVNNSVSRRQPEGQRIADPVEALLKQLESLSGDAIAGDDIVPHGIDHRMRMLFSLCGHKLRAAQVEMERATTESQIMKERSKALFAQASSLVSDFDVRLSIAQSTRCASEAYAAEIIARADAYSLDVLVSAIELADSYVGHQEIGADAVDNWISEKASQITTATIHDLESRVVEIGSVGEDVAPRDTTTTLNAA